MFKSVLKDLRKQNDLTQPELARILGVSVGAIGNWETGNRMPDTEKLDEIADYFRVSVDYLLGRTDSPEPTQTGTMIPVVGVISCGLPILAQENIEQYISVPDDVDADFCLRCKGDSMIGARIMDGDIVYIKQQSDVRDGQIAAVLVDDEATLKRVYRSGGSITLLAENPSYPPQVYTQQNSASVRILGLAVAFTSRL